jgi:hypothetical protein
MELGAYRIIAEVVGGALLVLALVGLWFEHNHVEQQKGATGCIISTTETKDEATEKAQASQQQAADIVGKVAQTYDQKIADLNAANADLAQRLHDAHANPVRSSAVPGVPAAAGAVCSAASSAGPTDCDRREAEVLRACADNTVELEAMREAWADLAAKH